MYSLELFWHFDEKKKKKRRGKKEIGIAAEYIKVRLLPKEGQVQVGIFNIDFSHCQLNVLKMLNKCLS